MRVVLLCHAATSAIGPPRSPVTSRWTRPAWLGPRTGRHHTPGRPGAPGAVRALPADRRGDGVGRLPESGLAGCDFGAWTGRTLDDVLGATPDGGDRVADRPTACPHGGRA